MVMAMMVRSVGGDPNKTNNKGSTPILLAAELGKLKTVEALVRHKAKPSIRNKTNTTPLHRAVGNNHPECIRLLLQLGAEPDLNYQSDFGYTPLALAATNGYTMAARALLEHKAD